MQDQVIAYIDGSFNPTLNKYSFGCFIMTPDDKEFEYIGFGNDSSLLSMRNVTGELFGAIFVSFWCQKQGYHSLKIVYDYAGIESWVTGKWKAKKPFTEYYTQIMNRYRRVIDISFEKVMAHTGVENNVRVDRLAKMALNCKIPSEPNKQIYIKRVVA